MQHDPDEFTALPYEMQASIISNPFTLGRLTRSTRKASERDIDEKRATTPITRREIFDYYSQDDNTSKQIVCAWQESLNVDGDYPGDTEFAHLIIVNRNDWEELISLQATGYPEFVSIDGVSVTIRQFDAFHVGGGEVIKEVLIEDDTWILDVGKLAIAAEVVTEYLTIDPESMLKILRKRLPGVLSQRLGNLIRENVKREITKISTSFVDGSELGLDLNQVHLILLSFAHELGLGRRIHLGSDLSKPERSLLEEIEQLTHDLLEWIDSYKLED